MMMMVEATRKSRRLGGVEGTKVLRPGDGEYRHLGVMVRDLRGLRGGLGGRVGRVCVVSLFFFLFFPWFLILGRDGVGVCCALGWIAAPVIWLSVAVFGGWRGAIFHDLKRGWAGVWSLAARTPSLEMWLTLMIRDCAEI